MAVIANLAVPNLSRRQSDARAKLPTLPALTSLRFFAAYMIVLTHLAGHFANPHLKLINQFLPLESGVSLFFVLSGFVLTYQNFEREGSTFDVINFFKARFARIYPLHLVTALLALLVFPGVLDHHNLIGCVGIVCSNLCLLQAWIPNTSYFISLNGPSWSISNELFFYAMFPLLLKLLRVSEYRVLLLGASLTAVCIFAAAIVNMGGSEVSLRYLFHWILYINPLIRLFEFILGMVAARQFLRLPKLSNSFAAILQAFAAALVLIFGLLIARNLDANVYKFDPISYWLHYCGLGFFFAVLIFSLALGRGWLFTLLNRKSLIYLGEASYSTYLLHLPLIYAVLMLLRVQSEATKLFVYVPLLMVASIMSYEFIEKPGRRVLSETIDRVRHSFRQPIN